MSGNSIGFLVLSGMGAIFVAIIVFSIVSWRKGKKAKEQFFQANGFEKMQIPDKLLGEKYLRTYCIVKQPEISAKTHMKIDAMWTRRTVSYRLRVFDVRIDVPNDDSSTYFENVCAIEIPQLANMQFSLASKPQYDNVLGKLAAFAFDLLETSKAKVMEKVPVQYRAEDFSKRYSLFSLNSAKTSEFFSEHIVKSLLAMNELFVIEVLDGTLFIVSTNIKKDTSDAYLRHSLIEIVDMIHHVFSRV